MWVLDNSVLLSCFSDHLARFVISHGFLLSVNALVLKEQLWGSSRWLISSSLNISVQITEQLLMVWSNTSRAMQFHASFWLSCPTLCLDCPASLLWLTTIYIMLQREGLNVICEVFPWPQTDGTNFSFYYVPFHLAHNLYYNAFRAYQNHFIYLPVFRRRPWCQWLVYPVLWPQGQPE